MKELRGPKLMAAVVLSWYSGFYKGIICRSNLSFGKSGVLKETKKKLMLPTMVVLGVIVISEPSGLKKTIHCANMTF